VKPIYILSSNYREVGQGTEWTAICRSKTPVVFINYSPLREKSRWVPVSNKRPYHVCELPRGNPLEPISRHATLGAALKAARRVAANCNDEAELHASQLAWIEAGGSIGKDSK
jgi:hypothetical protein